MHGLPEEELHSGLKSVVVRGPEPGTVTKRYRSSAFRTPRRAAEVEFTRMRRLHEALSAVEYASCPRPLHWGQQDGEWQLSMEEVPGASLLELMGQRDRPAASTVAWRLAKVLTVYAETFGEPHYGLKPQDVILENTTGTVFILDFEPSSKPGYLAAAGTSAGPAATSAAILLAMNLHFAAAPCMLHRPRAARWLVDVAVETLERLHIEQADELGDVVSAIYRKRYEAPRAWWRRTWYGLRWLDLARPTLRRAGLPRRPAWLQGRPAVTPVTLGLCSREEVGVMGALSALL